MVKQEPFAVEQFMDEFETGVTWNMAETCVESISISQVLEMAGLSEETVARELFSKKLVYGNIKGSPALKSAIASLYDDPDVKADDIVVTNGAIGANFLTFYTEVNPNDHIVTVSPSYQQLSSVPAMFGANVDLFPLEAKDNYSPNMEKLRFLISSNHSKLLVINNPNNPTGCVWENDTLEQIVSLCKEFDVTILCDEVYRPLYHTQTKETVKSILSFGYEKTISTGSMSKAFSLAGLRVGWIASRNKRFMQEVCQKRDYNTISVSILDDYISTIALENSVPILERNHTMCQNNLAILQEFIDARSDKVSWVRPRGGSTCFLKLNISISTMDFVLELIESHSVLVVPGEVFGYPGSIRLGFGNSTEHIKEGLKALGELLSRY